MIAFHTGADAVLRSAGWTAQPDGQRATPVRIRHGHAFISRAEEGFMMEAVVALIFIASLLVGPAVWSVWRDRSRERGLIVRAEIQNVVDRALGGESLVAVEVVPAHRWRNGRVIVSAPADWRWLIDAVWTRVLDRLPSNYELVVPGRAEPTAAEAELKRAA